MINLEIKVVGDKEAAEFLRTMGRAIRYDIVRTVTDEVFKEAKRRTPRSYGEYRDLAVPFKALKDSWEKPRITGNRATFSNVAPYAFVLEYGLYPPERLGTPKRFADRLGSRRRTITKGRGGRAFSEKGFVSSDPYPGGMVYPIISNKEKMEKLALQAIRKIRRKVKKRKGGAAIL